VTVESPTATKEKPKVLVAMSGGVDSSLVGALLAEQGYDIIGINMRTHRLSPEEIAQGAKIKTCCSPTDAKDARACAERSDFPFYVLDVEPAFEKDVIDPFLRAYMSGRTPNPCVLCNNHVKLGLLLEKAQLYGCEEIATGHYAIKERYESTGRWTLKKAKDTNKDQCYYLYGLTQDQLENIVFPLGELTKQEVREKARDAHLPTAEKPESQEICFVPDNNYRRFVRERLEQSGKEIPKGKIINTAGKVLGQHEGIAFYTVGQRRGLGISDPKPYYVVAIDADTNNVIVGRDFELYFEGLEADGLNWMALEGLTKPVRSKVQIRYRHAPAWATIEPTDDEDKVRIWFDQPQKAVSPGQAVVFWDEDDYVLGGGWIIGGVHCENTTENSEAKV